MAQTPHHKIRMDDGARIALWDTGGSDAPVVFIHGFPENHHSWDELQRTLPRGHRYLCYDLRGFGESSKTGEASLDRFFQDHQTIVKALELPRYHLVGHDWGGAVGLHVARYAPDSLATLAVLNTNYWKTDLRGMPHLIFLNLPLVPNLAFGLFPKQLFQLSMKMAFVDRDRLRPETAESFLEMFRDPAATNYWIKLYRRMAKKLLSRRLVTLKLLLGPFSKPDEMRGRPLERDAGVLESYVEEPRKRPTKQIAGFEMGPRSFQVPTTLIWGEKDRFNPVWIGEDIRKNLIKRGTRVTWNLIPNAGHFVHEEQPKAVAKCLESHWS